MCVGGGGFKIPSSVPSLFHHYSSSDDHSWGNCNKLTQYFPKCGPVTPRGRWDFKQYALVNFSALQTSDFELQLCRVRAKQIWKRINLKKAVMETACEHGKSLQVVCKWLKFGNHRLNGSLWSPAPLPIDSWLSCHMRTLLMCYPARNVSLL